MQTTVSRWPHDEKIAVMVTIMFEVWSEGKAPPYSPMTTSLKPGTPDLLGISWSQYGGKTGIWRFMRILDETGIPATVCLNAKGAELFPEAVKELNARGQEIAGHFYTQDSILPYLSPEEEREVIQRCSRIIEKAVGTRLTGWFSPVAAPTVHTADFWRKPTRKPVSAQFNGPRPLWRAAHDVGDAEPAPALHERFCGSLVCAPRPNRPLGARTALAAVSYEFRVSGSNSKL